MGQRAASSHTAALAGSEAAVDALFRQAGVIRAESLEELIDTATLLSSQPRLDGRRVAILTNAGGLGILCADACDAAGLQLPPFTSETTAALRRELPAEASLENPVDMLGSATARTYAAALPHLLSDAHIDAVIALFVPAVSATAHDVAQAVEIAAREAGTDKPVLGVVMSSDGIPHAFRDRATRVAAYSLSRIGCACARPRRRARRMVAAAPGHRSGARRHRPVGRRERRRRSARARGRRLAQRRRDTPAARSLRRPARTRAGGRVGRRGCYRRTRASVSRAS